MTDHILRDCKKLLIQDIINPGLYWMTEYGSGKHYSKEIKQFECLLEKNVEKFKVTKEIRIGSMVAVKDKTGFHRGLVTDIFNRDSKIMYWVSLTDQGRVIETTEKSIYGIKNKELMIKKPNMFKVSIKGIHPASLVLDCSKHVSGYIFQKRKCVDWSSASLKFVINLFEKNPEVFVKGFKYNEKEVSAEIYYIQKSNGMLTSLGQKLCDEGFAVSDEMPKYEIKNYLKDLDDNEIEEKIPKNAYFRETNNFVRPETIEQKNNFKPKWIKTLILKYAVNDPSQELLQNPPAQTESSGHCSTSTVFKYKI